MEARCYYQFHTRLTCKRSVIMRGGYQKDRDPAFPLHARAGHCSVTADDNGRDLECLT